MNKIIKSSGNVFEDVGLPDSEALLAKAKLASKIADAIGADKYQRTHIVLWEPVWISLWEPSWISNSSDLIGRLVSAPAGFDWMSYPEFIEMEDKKWRYVGTMDAVPYYRPA